MFEFDAGKLLIVGIVALIVIGPKDLPRVMRHVGQAVGKLRRLGAEFQAQFMEAMREADAQDIKADVDKLTQSAKIDLGSDPLAQIKSELMMALEERTPSTAPAGEAAAAVSAPVEPVTASAVSSQAPRAVNE